MIDSERLESSLDREIVVVGVGWRRLVLGIWRLGGDGGRYGSSRKRGRTGASFMRSSKCRQAG